MRIAPWIVVGVVLVPWSASVAPAQQPVVDSIRIAVAQLGARLDSVAAGQCGVSLPPIPSALTGNPVLDSALSALGRVADRLQRLSIARCSGVGLVAQATPDSAMDELAAIRQAAAAAAGAGNEGVPAAVDTQFVGRQRNLNKLNPEISATGDVRFVARNQSPPVDNAVAREFEFAFQSDLDPYSRTKIFLTFEGEEVGVEEGYIYYTGLPGGLRVDAGLFRQVVGDLNRWHLHALPETEYPLVYRRFLGEEGLSGPGLSIYTVLPVSLFGGTHEAWVQATAAESEPLYAGSRQPTLLGRVQNFWQLTRSTYVQAGFTAAGGNAADARLRSRLQGVDFRLTWRPPNTGTRQDLTIRAEGYRLRAHEDDVATTRYGGFVDLQYKASRRWVLGGRYDNVEAPRGAFSREWAVTPTLTWWQSEFVYLRLEGALQRQGVGSNWTTSRQLSFQVVWAMGPHKHETY